MSSKDIPLATTPGHAVASIAKNTYNAAGAAYRALQPAIRPPVDSRNLLRKSKENLQERWYDPLSTTTSIRLLDLKPGKPSDVLECTLHEVDLVDSPSYIALSYSWIKDESWSHFTMSIIAGFFIVAVHLTIKVAKIKAKNLWEHLISELSRSQEKSTQNSAQNGPDIAGGAPQTHSGDQQASQETKSVAKKIIWCNGQLMHIQENLYDCLLQLRSFGRGPYWIDAICINQTDKDERTAQVNMMGSIYSAANEVFVWLGLCPAMLAPGIEALLAPTTDIDGPSPNSRSSFTHEDDVVYHTRRSIATMYLLSRRWFKRLWVIQEACLARDITFLFDKYRMATPDLLRACSWLTQERSSLPYFNLYAEALILLNSHIQCVPLMFEWRTVFEGGGKWSLYQWLQICNDRSSTDARDLLFAGLGLLDSQSLKIDYGVVMRNGTESFQETELWPCLRADYEASIDDVLLNIAACLLTHHQGLDWFSIATQCSGSKRKTPSWFPRSTGGSDMHAMVGLPGMKFHACTQISHRPKISPDRKTLIIEATILDNVRAYSEPFGTTGHIISRHPEKFFAFLADINCDAESGGQCSLEQLAHAITAGAVERRGIDPVRILRGFILWIQVEFTKIAASLSTEDMEKLNALYQKLKVLHRHQRWPTPDTPKTEEDHELLEQFKAELTPSIARCLFVTHGGLLGLGPGEMGKNILVALVKSGRVPYLFVDYNDDIDNLINDEKKYADMSARWVPGFVMEAYGKSIERLEKKKGDNQGRLLVGEAYVHGFMFGKAGMGEMAFEEMRIV